MSYARGHRFWWVRWCYSKERTPNWRSKIYHTYSFTAIKSIFLRLPSSSFSVNPTYYHKISLEYIHLFVWKFLLVISVCLPHYHQISFSSHPTKCHNSTLQLMAKAFLLDKPRAYANMYFLPCCITSINKFMIVRTYQCLKACWCNRYSKIENIVRKMHSIIMFAIRFQMNFLIGQIGIAHCELWIVIRNFKLNLIWICIILYEFYWVIRCFRSLRIYEFLQAISVISHFP